LPQTSHNQWGQLEVEDTHAFTSLIAVTLRPERPVFNSHIHLPERAEWLRRQKERPPSLAAFP